MIYIVGGLAAWAILVMFALAFNHGAHCKTDPREFRRIRNLEFKK
jgi:hypothetical protein